MTQSKSSGDQNKQSAYGSGDNKANTKAGQDTGAGGGAKQKHHR